MATSKNYSDLFDAVFQANQKVRFERNEHILMFDTMTSRIKSNVLHFQTKPSFNSLPKRVEFIAMCEKLKLEWLQ